MLLNKTLQLLGTVTVDELHLVTVFEGHKGQASASGDIMLETWTWPFFLLDLGEGNARGGMLGTQRLVDWLHCSGADVSAHIEHSEQSRPFSDRVTEAGGLRDLKWVGESESFGHFRFVPFG